jgi:hypothetical protein
VFCSRFSEILNARLAPLRWIASRIETGNTASVGINIPLSQSHDGLGVARPSLEPLIGSASNFGIRIACSIDRAAACEVPDG